MAFIPSNILRWSPYNLPGPTLYGYETLDSSATVSVTTYFDLVSPNPSGFEFNVNDQINCSCSDGTVILRVASLNPTITEATYVSVGPNSVNTAAIQNGAVTRAKTAGLAYDDLSNLASVAVNSPIIPAADDSIDLGMDGKRWNELYATSLQAGHTNGNTMTLSGWDVDGAAKVDFFTITSSNTPTGVLGSTVTAATQAPLTSNTTVATTKYVDDAVTAGGGGGANVALSNLAGVAINTSLVSDADLNDDLGSPTKRWNNLYSANITTGQTAGNTTIVGAWDVDGGSLTPFLTLTANNTPTGVLASAITATTQAPLDNSTKLATTAYTDAAVAAVAGGANQALSNLAAVAINTTLVSDTDITDDLGTQAIRWNNIYAKSIQTGDTASDTLTLSGWDVDGATAVPFFTITANNTPTAVLASSVTATTQAASDNSTKLATTAYADAAAAAVSGANVALSNLSGVAINTTLVSDADNTDDLGDITHRWKNVYATNITTDHTDTHTLSLSGWDVDGSSSIPFFTITAGNTPTAVLSGSVTSTTQSASDNSTKLATTAYVDNQVSSISANKALSNLSSVAINTSLLPALDNSIAMGSGTKRTSQIFSAGLTTGTTAADTLIISARDVDGASEKPFITLTANNTPTCVLDSAVTATTQAASDNSTKISTTAYADSAATTAAADRAPKDATYIVQTSNGTLTNEQVLGSLATGIVKNTTTTGVLSIAANGTDYYGPGTATPIPVTEGGSGRNTGTTAYGLIAAGTTATGVQQTVSPGTSGLPLVSAGASALPSYTGLTVSGGGTGVTSNTAYAVLCGGTTSTNPVQSIASVGTAGQVLTSNGAGALPTFQAAASSGSWTHLASVTASASASMDFTSSISSTYDLYAFKFTYVLAATDATSGYIRLRTGGAFKSGASDYGWGCVMLATQGSSTGDTKIQCTLGSYLSNTSTKGFSGLFFLVDPSSTTKHKAVYGNGAVGVTGTTIYYNLNSGGALIGFTTAVDGFQFLTSSGNVTSGRIDMYGISN